MLPFSFGSNVALCSGVDGDLACQAFPELLCIYLPTHVVRLSFAGTIASAKQYLRTLVLVVSVR